MGGAKGKEFNQVCVKWRYTRTFACIGIQSYYDWYISKLKEGVLNYYSLNIVCCVSILDCL